MCIRDRPISIKGIVDFDMVLDEMWAVAQEEMNFLLEASNMEEFAGNNRDVAFVATPKLYRKYTTSHVLVMEYIKGFDEYINTYKAAIEAERAMVKALPL